jgi:hypothetical protein
VSSHCPRIPGSTISSATVVIRDTHSMACAIGGRDGSRSSTLFRAVRRAFAGPFRSTQSSAEKQLSDPPAARTIRPLNAAVSKLVRSRFPGKDGNVAGGSWHCQPGAGPTLCFFSQCRAGERNAFVCLRLRSLMQACSGRAAGVQRRAEGGGGRRAAPKPTFTGVSRLRVGGVSIKLRLIRRFLTTGPNEGVVGTQHALRRGRALRVAAVGVVPRRKLNSRL